MYCDGWRAAEISLAPEELLWPYNMLDKEPSHDPEPIPDGPAIQPGPGLLDAASLEAEHPEPGMKTPVLTRYRKYIRSFW